MLLIMSRSIRREACGNMPEKAAGKCSEAGRGLAASEPLSDEAIISRVMDGDLAAFELIMRRYNQRLFRVARGILESDVEAEDVVQDSYIRAYEHLDEFEGRARFSTWLTRIVVYAATKRRRKMRRVRLFTSDEEPLHLAETADGPAESVSRSETRTLLARAVDALPAELRVVVIMRLVEGLDTEETARTLDLTPANVKVRLHRARALLRESIEERLEGEVTALYQFDGERCDRIVRAVFSRIGIDHLR
jgi:RNA polymerase sigma-70 factor (ECF subfamily)